MRYLKVTAQDRSANRRADTLLLEFFEVSGRRDKLSHKAYALDITADGKVDFAAGDVTNDGKENRTDARLLGSFANAFLQLNWFNAGNSRDRYLKIFVDDFDNDGSPDTVRLHFHEGGGLAGRETLAYTASAYDTDNDAKIDWVVNYDTAVDGMQDVVDKKIISRLSSAYMKFGWR